MKFEDVQAELAKMAVIRNRLANNEIYFNTMTLDELTELDRIITTIVAWTQQYAPDNSHTSELLTSCNTVAYFTQIHIKMREQQ